HPVKAVGVANAVDEVIQTVAVDVSGEDLDAGLSELPFGVPRPGARVTVGGAFKPAFGRQKVDAAVAVDVARADAVRGGGLAKVVFGPLGLGAGLGQLVPHDDVGAVGQHVGPAVAVQVDEDRGLAGAG